MGVMRDQYGNIINTKFVISDDLLINIRYWARISPTDAFIKAELDQFGLAANRLLASLAMARIGSEKCNKCGHSNVQLYLNKRKCLQCGPGDPCYVE